MNDLPFERPQAIDLPAGRVTMPAFLPDATSGVVRGVDPAALTATGTVAVMMNAFHLMRKPGRTTVEALGGLKGMSAWPGPIFTDSGGFQAYSLVRQGVLRGSITSRGISWKDGTGGKTLLTPEKSVRLQVAFGADVVFCLDDCTHPGEPIDVQTRSVERTVEWASRCRNEFDSAVAKRSAGKPLIFAVIQGGASRELRRRCALELQEIGFDGYAYGGWPFDDKGRLFSDLLRFTRDLVPGNLPMHALGVGSPAAVAECAAMGYGLFDSAYPTRVARRGTLFAFTDGARPGTGKGWFSRIDIRHEKHRRRREPLSALCRGECCTSFCAGFLHHLFAIKDSLYARLATIHNLRFMNELTRRLGAGEGEHIEGGP